MIVRYISICTLIILAAADFAAGQEITGPLPKGTDDVSVEKLNEIDLKKPLDNETTDGKDAKPRRRPLVVLRQTEIEGRVFFIGVGKKKEEKAVKLKIEVLRSDNDDRIYKTKTDKEGRYVLPNLEAGMYRLVLGKLVLDLEVKERESDDEDSRPKSIPKKLLVFIPRELRG